jgi:hypothetical protein
LKSKSIWDWDDYDFQDGAGGGGGAGLSGAESADPIATMLDGLLGLIAEGVVALLRDLPLPAAAFIL